MSTEQKRADAVQAFFFDTPLPPHQVVYISCQPPAANDPVQPKRQFKLFAPCQSLSRMPWVKEGDTPGMLEWGPVQDMKCSNDHHLFSGVPVPYVTRYDSEQRGFVLGEPHLFCSVNCKKRYIMDRVGTCAAEPILTVAGLMAREVCGIQEFVFPAPPVCLLQGYAGGFLAIGEYRHNFTFVTGRLIRPPFITGNMLVEFTHHDEPQGLTEEQLHAGHMLSAKRRPKTKPTQPEQLDK